VLRAAPMCGRFCPVRGQPDYADWEGTTRPVGSNRTRHAYLPSAAERAYCARKIVESAAHASRTTSSNVRLVPA
jgi:hypothetical protein